MPEFPRYESKAALTTQQPSFLAAESTEGKITEKIGEAAGAVGTQAAKFLDAVNTMQKSTAAANFKTGSLGIQQAFQEIPNPTIKDYNDAQGKISKLKTDSLKGISSKATEREVAIGLDYESKVAGIQLDNQYKKKIVEAGQTAVLTLIDTEVQNPSPGSLKYINDLLNVQVDKGIFGQKEAYEKLKKAEKDIKTNSFIRDMQTDPQAAESKLKNNEYGFDIAELEKARTIKEKAQTREKEIIEETKFNNAVDAGVQLATGTLTRDSLDVMESNGMIEPEIAGAFEIAMFSPKWKDFESATEDKLGMSAQFLLSVVDKMDNFNPKTATAVMKDALTAYNSSPQKINENDLTWIIRSIDDRRKSQNDPKWGKLTSAVKWMAGLSIGSEAVQTFIKKWTSKDDPIAVAQQAAQEASIKDNPKASAYEVGKRYKHGVYIGINPETGKLMFDQ